MKFATDHFFTIGRHHERNGLPCQDYAISGQLGNSVTYAIVADGCTSSPDTDVGARLVAAWFRQVLHMWQLYWKRDYVAMDKSKNEFTKSFRRRFETDRDTIETFPLQCLDASLVAAIHLPDTNQIITHIMGDGVVVAKTKTGEVEIIYPEWRLNAPPYMSYHLSDARARALIEAYDKDGSQHGQLNIKSSDGEVDIPDITMPLNIMEGLEDGGLTFTFDMSKDYESISVCSDGILQLEDVKPLEAAIALTDVKVPGGTFVKRTCRRRLKDMDQTSNVAEDDFSMATILILED
jgi:hypothetical protein